MDEDYYALELVKSAVGLVEANTFEDVEKYVNLVVDRAQQLTREKYATLAATRVVDIKSELHDEAVQAQGGL